MRRAGDAGGWHSRLAARGDERRARRASRRESRAREREALKRLPRRERLGAWWRTRPLGLTFTVYLGAYLAVATVLTLGLIELLSTWNNGYYELEVTFENGLTQRGVVDSGPYIYDPVARELLPASELDLPGNGPLAVFIATGDWEAGDDYAPEGADAASVIHATVDMVRDGQVQLYDWGLNYNEWYPQEEVLEVNNSISADNLARYDELSRANRLQSVELFESMTDADLEETFGENLVSNTAYYAASQRPAGPMPWILAIATGLAPVLAYGGLGWITFRRFYRVHIAGPLGELSGAAERIARQDLDFSIERVRGKELGRLSERLEDMRASLLDAQRELWRTAEGRRRLNAAFAHDMRTPITVLKGTVEMAQMRLRRGDALAEESLNTLSSQVMRLERYATEMGGLTKLEDRPVERRIMPTSELVDELAAHAAEVVAARGEGLGLRVSPQMPPVHFGRAGTAGKEPMVDPTPPIVQRPRPHTADMGSGLAYVDLSLVEEVLDNLLSNACGHARGVVGLEAVVREGELVLRVSDDGPGFTPEALRRGCDPFFSENKSAVHFGLGLNVSSILCGLHGGALDLANGEMGGACASATFDVDGTEREG